MGELIKRMERMVVRATSPDGRITATLSQLQQLDLAFASGAYRQYREPVLARQLGSLATGVPGRQPGPCGPWQPGHVPGLS